VRRCASLRLAYIVPDVLEDQPQRSREPRVHGFVPPMTIEHETFVRAAIALAEEAMRYGDEPFGALLVVDGEVKLKARNQVVTECDPTRHAELSLVSDACRRLDSAALARSTLYASTEPCVMCCGAIYWSQVPRVVFGCSATTLGTLSGGSLVVPSSQVFGRGRRPVEVLGPLLEEEAVVAHREFWSPRAR